MRVRPPDAAARVDRNEPRRAGLFRFCWLWGAIGLFWSLTAQAWQCTGAAVRVHDGDTISIRCERGLIKVRLADIDAPELHQAYGVAARAALAQMTQGETIRIESVAVDRYQRVVARLYLADESLGLRLVAQGLAWCGLRPVRGCRERLDAARAAGRGLWAQSDPLPPWQWRKQHPRRD